LAEDILRLVSDRSRRRDGVGVRRAAADDGTDAQVDRKGVGA
jgi:hypothetical protein